MRYFRNKDKIFKTNMALFEQQKADGLIAKLRLASDAQRKVTKEHYHASSARN
jgi:hypothetical protein